MDSNLNDQPDQQDSDPNSPLAGSPLEDSSAPAGDPDRFVDPSSVGTVSPYSKEASQFAEDPDASAAAQDGDDSNAFPFFSIDPRQVTLDRIVGAIFCVVVFVGAVVGMLIYFFSIDSVDWIFGCVSAGVVLVFLLLAVSAVVWPPLEFRNVSWRLLPTGMEIRRGVFWKHQISIPTSRVQHVDVLQGPLQRNFGLSTLTIHTAGTSNASVELSGLNFETATELRDRLVEQREALNVV